MIYFLEKKNIGSKGSGNKIITINNNILFQNTLLTSI